MEFFPQVEFLPRVCYFLRDLGLLTRVKTWRQFDLDLLTPSQTWRQFDLVLLTPSQTG